MCVSQASLVAQMIKHVPAMQETQFEPWVRNVIGTMEKRGQSYRESSEK